MDDIVFFGLQWAIGIFAFATLAVFALLRKQRGWRWISTRLGIALSLYVALQVANPYLLTMFPRDPVDTDAVARTRLAKLVKHRLKDRRSSDELEKKIDDIRIAGPVMNFDPPTTRYVTFTYDDGCGLPIEARARLMPRSGELMGAPFHRSDYPIGCDSR